MIALDSVKHLKVLVMGDAIMDEYVYVKVIGKAVKENALSALAGKRELFKGGVWAAAKHTANFCDHVDVWRGPMTMWNSRLVDDVYLRKLFVVHELRENDEDSHQHTIKDYDLVIVTDFGHGTMTRSLIERVSYEARFLAVNTQTNSTNFGFNVIKKYPRADFVVLDELEARLAMHDNHSPLELVIEKLDYPCIIVTRGTQGAIGYDGCFETVPALTHSVIDTMGAGDAFFAVAAPFAAIGAKLKDVIRIGNAAGAVKVGIVGHRSSVTPHRIYEQLGIEDG